MVTGEPAPDRMWRNATRTWNAAGRQPRDVGAVDFGSTRGDAIKGHLQSVGVAHVEDRG